MDISTNYFGRPLFFPEKIEEYSSFSTEKLKELLSLYKNNGYLKSRILVALGHRNELDSIFDELVDVENQKKEALFGLSIAQIAGLIIVDHANEVQIHRLIEEIKKWTVAYQLDDFLYLLKKHKITII